MKQLQPGLFLVEAQMPCLPSDIRTGEGFLPDNFQEEVAAIVVSFSRQVNQWVGVSLDHLQENLPTGVFVQSAQQLSVGIGELMQKEMLTLDFDQDEPSIKVVFPTPALISHILQKQRVILAN